MSKTVAVLSGGLDSTVALAYALDRGVPLPVEAVTFTYGQNHTLQEVAAARKVAEHLAVPWREIPLEGLFTDSTLTGQGRVPKGTYEQVGVGETEVVGRNLLFASIALSLVGRGGTILLGVHGGEHELYPDCTPQFWDDFGRVAEAYDVKVLTPLLDWSKGEVVREGMRLGAPLHLTYSCYVGGPSPCGECSTCRERAEAFKTVGVDDPANPKDPLGVAIRLGEDSARNAGGPFGAVVVTREGRTYTGTNRVTLANDPTAHAEVVALREAAKVEGFNLEGAVLYSSCQPCPMCLTAAMWARVDEVVYAATDIQAASAGFDDASFYEQLRDGLSSVTSVRVTHEVRGDALNPFRAWELNVERVSY